MVKNMNENMVSLYENSIEKSHSAVSKPFNFDQTKELIALLQRLFYIKYFIPARDEKEYLAERVREVLEKELIIYCNESTVREQLIQQFEDSLPEIERLVISDIEAAYEGDPAADSPLEIIAAYPGPFAIMIQRVAHKLYKLKVPVLPRIMTEYAHSMTGIDIHPGAGIGEKFFIDHGTGVVIGETAVVGKCVKMYQGVTLGALSTSGGQRLKHLKRHPTVEDDVTIYAGATILGGNTRIGKGAVIGGNTWITESVPMHSKVSPNVIDMQIRQIFGRT